MMRSSEDIALIRRFLDEELGGLRPETLAAYRMDLELVARWLQERRHDLVSAGEVQLLNYLTHDLTCGIAIRSVARRLVSLRSFYRFLHCEGLISQNPTTDIPSPIIGQSSAKTISEEDVTRLLNAPDPRTVLGMRDRAMLQTLYSTGLKASEMVNLTLSELDLNGPMPMVRVAGKVREVPLGEEAVIHLQGYLNDCRPELLGFRQSDTVFLTSRGRPMGRHNFWSLIKRYAAVSGVGHNIFAESLRHSFATHLLNHGVDLTDIQQYLGHANLSSTQIYTHIAQARLREIHRRHHPREIKYRGWNPDGTTNISGC